tara:strand:+ start:390 stop:1451 length:1062 start_codon:yes stop_codon:yes gene_type:complete
MGRWLTHRAWTRAGTARFIALAISLGPPVLQANASETLLDLQSALQSIYRDRQDAIVRVKAATAKQDGDKDPKAELLVLSGFFVSQNGEVLTSHMPPDRTTRVWIEQKGISYLAEVIGTDARTNVALLQVINLPKNFGFIELNRNKERQAIGSLAFAITSPLDFKPTPKFGLVTGLESHFAEFIFPLTYTRLSIPIGPAEGGSPVFDANNELIGILMGFIPEVESSYIVPTKALDRIVAQLKTYQKIKYGLLPMEFEEKADEYNIERQVLVKSIVAGSPAERSGLQAKDVITSIGGQAIANLNDLRDLIFFKNPGDFLLFTIKRGTKELEFNILLEPQEDHLPENGSASGPDN